jgi:2-polyprenyl-6-methoxyphenol hydroxylase-like FAD-dependent oxidoreductase
MKTQVLIAGAGPTGLSLAAQLIRYNIDFVIFDKNESPTPLSKAVGVHARTLEIYDQLDLGRKAVQLGQPMGVVNMNNNGKKTATLSLEDFGKGLSPHPYMLILEQSKNERLLYDYLLQHNKIVLWDTELIHFTQDDHAVTVNVKNKQGEEQHIEADYFVGCDGSKSVVRQQLGFRFEGSTFEEHFYVADAKVDWNKNYGTDLDICTSKDTLAIFFPMKGDQRFRIVGTLPKNRSADQEILMDEIEYRIKNDSKIPLEISDIRWFAIYKVHSRMTNAFVDKRCMIAGDAAHIHTPAGGQGMNTGIQDAYNLAWKLALILKGQAKPALLDSYNEERMANAKNLLKTTDNYFKLEGGGGAMMAFVRQYILPTLMSIVMQVEFIKRKIFLIFSQTGITYKENSLKIDSKIAKINAGDRMPYFMIDQSSSIYDLLKQPSFHLIGFGKASNTATDINGVDIRNIQLPKAPGHIFGNNNDFYVLVRPDNYIAYIGADMEQVKRFVREKIAR